MKHKSVITIDCQYAKQYNLTDSCGRTFNKLDLLNSLVVYIHTTQ